MEKKKNAVKGMKINNNDAKELKEGIEGFINQEL